MNKRKCPTDLAFLDGCYDAHGGQIDCSIAAYDKPKTRYYGRIDYSLFDDKLYINMIEIEPDVRRCGIATRLLDELTMLHPLPINFGYATREGYTFLEAYKKRDDHD